jgi:hypothetical protein
VKLRRLLQKEYSVAVPRQVVWEALGRAIYRDLPLERIDIVNEHLFYADMRWKSGLPLVCRIKVTLTQISAPERLDCVIGIHKGIIKLDIGVNFELRQIDLQITSVDCTVVIHPGMAAWLSYLVNRQLRSFAGEIVETIGGQLQRLCAVAN